MSAIAMTVGDFKEVLNKYPDFYELHIQVGNSSVEALYAGDVADIPITATTTYQGLHWLVLVPYEELAEKSFHIDDFVIPSPYKIGT